MRRESWLLCLSFVLYVLPFTVYLHFAFKWCRWYYMFYDCGSSLSSSLLSCVCFTNDYSLRLGSISLHDSYQSCLKVMFEPGHSIAYKITCTSSDEPDQSVHLHSLSSLAGQSVGSQGSSSSGQRRLWSACASRRLIWVFVSRTCIIIGNAVSRLISTIDPLFVFFSSIYRKKIHVLFMFRHYFFHVLISLSWRSCT